MSNMNNILESLQSGLTHQQYFEPGLYEIHYEFHAPDFDSESMIFDWRGRKTGPWDYAPYGPKNGECLLPKVHFKTNEGFEMQARVFIPRREALDKKRFAGRLGFRLHEAGEVTIELSASENVEWTHAEFVRVDDFADHSLRAADFKTNCRFFLSDQKLSQLKGNWGRSTWCRHLDRILNDCGRFSPPTNLADARKVSSVYLQTDATYDDDVLFWGTYLAGLSLRSLALNNPEDIEQLISWVDALVELPIWGNSDDPFGRDHNNDLTADFNMIGLVLALNWNGHHFGPERIQRIQEKIHYQARAMLKWIIHARSSWPGVKTQNHAYFGYQTLLLAGAALLHRDREYQAEALDWLQIAGAAFKRFTANLPSDGSYHEGYGYIAFGLFGLMPPLFLLEQITDRAWLPMQWLTEHFPAMNDMMHNDAQRGFDIDDGDGYAPCNLAMTIWAWQNAPNVKTSHAAGQILAKLRQGREEIDLEPNRTMQHLWRLILTPEVTDLGDSLPALQAESWSHRLLPTGGCCIFRPTTQSKAYFLTAPPHGHEQFKNENHTYAYGHHHPDVGNLLLVDNGQWVLADTGFTYCKASSEHNVLLVNDQGQFNDRYVWMAPPPWDIQPNRVRVEESKAQVRASIDIAYIYPKELGLISWKRTVYVNSGCLTCCDEIQSKEPSIFTLNWGSELPWTKLTDSTFSLPNRWRFSHIGDPIHVEMETVNPAFRFNENENIWYALRLRNPEPTRNFKVISEFTAPIVGD